jgi:hypothetical protein
MKKFSTLFTLLYLISGEIFATESLQLRDVNSWWNYGQGIIDSASLLVEPKGFYAECTLILEFAADETQFGSMDSLEVNMNFRLPEGSEITDLVLWINDDPITGDWYDRWTASLIYEGIVRRRIDPAILTKSGSNEFNIKVFPLLTYLKRKIKIRYLTPINNLMTSRPSVPIPYNILKLSSSLPTSVKVAFKEGSNFSGPGILENESVLFAPSQDPDFGNCQSALITDLDSYSSLNLTFSQKETKSINLITYTDSLNGENYYQLSIEHSLEFGSVQNRKALFLVDYIDDNCSAYTKDDLLHSLEFSIRNAFAPGDSFNILFSGMVTTFPEENWVAADSEGISAFFNKLDNSLFNSYSNLPTLLIDGIDFVKKHGNDGSLVLISSSNAYGDPNPANSLITDYMHSLEHTEIPIHIIDLDDRNYDYYEQHYIGGQYFRGNEYFYTRLSQLTVGEYYSVRTRSLMSMLEQVNHRISGYFKSLEVIVQTNGGYAFSNYKLNATGGLIYNDESFTITGQYLGTAPFIVTLYGQRSDGIVYHVSDTLYDENILKGDSTIRSVWAAFKIKDLMGQEKSNQLIDQIITTSLNERILTDYTAILVLEPGFVIPDEDDEEDNHEFPTSIDPEIKDKDFGLSVFPNPVTTSSIVSYKIKETGHIVISLYDEKGEQVSTLVDETLSPGEYSATLKAEALPSGIYICVLVVDGRIVGRIKLVVN